MGFCCNKGTVDGSLRCIRTSQTSHSGKSGMGFLGDPYPSGISGRDQMGYHRACSPYQLELILLIDRVL